MTRTLKSGRRFECHAGERLARVAEQPPREPRGQIVQFGVVDDGAVLDAHVHEVQRPPRVARDLRRVVEVGPDRVAAAPRVLARVRVVLELPAWNSNLQPDFNMRVCDGFDASSLAVLRELDESHRFVQTSAASTSN